jgi:hypothetical protein
MSIIDRAFEMQVADSLKDAYQQLTTLESEIIDYDYEMYNAWIALCKAKGIAPDATAELAVDGENKELYEKFIHFSKLFTTTVRQHERLCNKFGIKRQIFPNIQRGSQDEQRSSNNRSSTIAQPNRRGGQLRGSDGGRLSRRRKKRQRR